MFPCVVAMVRRRVGWSIILRRTHCEGQSVQTSPTSRLVVGLRVKGTADEKCETSSRMKYVGARTDVNAEMWLTQSVTGMTTTKFGRVYYTVWSTGHWNWITSGLATYRNSGT